MLAFHTTPSQILEFAAADRLDDEIAAHLNGSGYEVNQQERASWRNSLSTLARHLCALGYDNLDALVEYQLPRSSRRVDVILAGVAPLTMRPAYLVVELKQWSRASRYDDGASLVRVPGLKQPQLHPAVQVQSYCAYLVDYLERLREWPQAVHGMAYLHNATRDQIPELPGKRTYQRLVYTQDRAAEFKTYLEQRFARIRDGRAAYRLLTSPVRQSKQLLTVTAEGVGSRHHFTLLDEQREAYELVMRAVGWAAEGRRKRVVIVAGGPGSGKSAIALTLLADLARQNRQVAHATGSKAFTESLQRYAVSQPSKGAAQRFRSQFSYFRDFMTTRPDSIDVLLCDEAHRLRAHSTKGQLTGTKPQVVELIEASKVPVFLLDDNQAVRSGEVGSVEMIKETVGELNLEFDLVNLGAQFRCGGSPRYEQWVQQVLGLVVGKPFRWSDDERFRLIVAGSPEEMEALLRRQHDQGETARMTAGFCWPWTLRSHQGQLVPDVKIGTWERPWNAKDEVPPQNIPNSSYWATDANGFGQVGCVYTAQGFEYHWAGVIMGRDLVVRNGRFISQPEESHDSAIFDRQRGRKRKGADRLIRNTYKVLFTRGLRGVVLYSVDPETQDFLTRLVPAPRRHRTVVAPGVERTRVRSTVDQQPGACRESDSSQLEKRG